MKGRPVDQIVYEYMFPKPRSTDPQTFHSLLHRHLILEVRQEVHSFYGHLDTPEAKYPGLDYCHRIHRIRLSRWPWHRRLFRAFDGLRLTHAEISGLTKWEGTKWAKERFEKDAGITITDTADEGFPEWVEPEDRPRTLRATLREHTQDLEDDAGDTVDEEMLAEEESEEELESIGTELNERLRERAARREAGDTSASLDDEEWEQWLKSVIESGGLPFLSEHILQQSNEMSNIPQALFPRMMSAARAGNWREIPESLHDMLRRTLECEALMEDNETPVPEAPISRASRPHNPSAASQWRRPYSNLRLPVGDRGASSATNVRLNRTAQPGA